MSTNPSDIKTARVNVFRMQVFQIEVAGNVLTLDADAADELHSKLGYQLSQSAIEKTREAKLQPGEF